MCDIKDLDEGGIELKHIYKRQIISPFNLFWMQNDMLEILNKSIKRMAKKDPQQMLSDKNFRFFQKSELNLDLAEIQISFNDLVILKGLQMKFDLMNKEFEKNLNKLRVDLIASNKIENKKISSVLSWLNKRQKFDKTKIELEKEF